MHEFLPKNNKNSATFIRYRRVAEEIGVMIKAKMDALLEGWETNMNHKLDEMRQMLIKFDGRLNEMDRQLKHV